jgi:iron complex outermembrane recepter protein
MGFQKNQRDKLFKKSLLALCVMAVTSPSFAQDDEKVEEVDDEVVVTGVRANLQNAQEIKRNSDTFVDAISSEDIGSLPDRSVLEAMQRIPGVSIERFAAANDPDHFGVEGSGAVVRGMTQTRSEFNGRDSFSANSGRGLNFQDVPPELMAGVDIYKNQTADMIEGGIAGTVSLRTRKPFDQEGRKVSFSADATYGDMVKELTPTVSALFSDRWETSAGEFGLLLNGSYSNLEASSHGIQTDRYEFRTLPAFTQGNTTFPGFSYVDNPYVYDGSFFFRGPNSGTAPTLPIGTKGVLVPNGMNMTMKRDTRDREGIALATQWESNDDSLLATFQFMRSDATLAWTENAIKSQMGYNNNTTYGAPGEEYEFDERGVFLSGSLANVVDGWRGNGNQVPHNLAPNAGWGGNPVYSFGNRFQTDNRYKKTHTVVDDYGFNLKWTPTDQLEITTDLQHIEATTEDDDVTLMFMTWAVVDADLRGLPNVSVLNPFSFKPAGQSQPFDYGDGHFTNEDSFLYNAAMDHFERSEGDSDAIRLDVKYEMDGFFNKLRVGVRAAEREQTVRNSAYNWDRLGPIWDDDGYWLSKPEVADMYEGDVTTLDWSNFYRGGVVNIQGGNKVLHPSDKITQDYANWGNIFEPLYDPNDSASCGDEWRPADQRVKAEWNGTSCVAEKLNNKYFLDNEINSTTETNNAAYVRVDFDTEVGSMRVNGNVGVRYVRIKNETKGFTTYPELARSNLLPSDWDPNNVDPADYDLFDENNEFLGDVNNFVSDDIVAFANKAYVPNVAERTYDDVLPSFNLKVEITPDVIGRFAVSKAIALPDIGDLRNYVNIGGAEGGTYNFLPAYWNASNPHPDANGHPSGLPQDPITGEPLEQQRIVDASSINFAGWNASAGNPNLKPMESTQFDVSAEWYFSNVGSLTASYFYKDLSNFFVNGSFFREFTNPVSGVTQNVFVSGPTNGESGKMEGFELGYQQFYDMLPEPFDGFGIQANYSNIQASGVPNSNLAAAAGDFTFQDSVPLQGQSEHTANFVLMYDKYDWSLRLAYNWRSEYLLTSRDVITGLPVYNDDSGFLDGSAFYNVTDNIQVGIQAVNLLNTETRTSSQVDGNMRLGRTWFVNDRRYTFLVRANF